MSQNYNDLAEKFMGLWQQQMQSMMKDGDFIKQCFDNLQNMTNYANAPGYEPAKPNSAAHHTHDALAYELRGLNHRLGVVEERLKRLERGGKAGAKRASGSAGKSGKKKADRAAKKRK